MSDYDFTSNYIGLLQQTISTIYLGKPLVVK